MPIVVPDVNVLVSKLNADRAGRPSTTSQKVVRFLVSGSIVGEPVQIAMSFKMLDTYRDVLLRNGYPEELVEEQISGLTGMMKFGPLGFDPYMVLGGSTDPALKDSEDGGVLATAHAARASLVITDNLKDFAGQDAETFQTSHGKTPKGMTRELYCIIRSRPDGKELAIVHPADFVSWTERDFRISPQSIRRALTKMPKPRGSVARMSAAICGARCPGCGFRLRSASFGGQAAHPGYSLETDGHASLCPLYRPHDLHCFTPRCAGRSSCSCGSSRPSRDRRPPAGSARSVDRCRNSGRVGSRCLR